MIIIKNNSITKMTINNQHQDDNDNENDNDNEYKEVCPPLGVQAASRLVGLVGTALQ